MGYGGRRIALIAWNGNRPVLQVGRHQVSCYDSQWLRDALCHAMHAAECDDFPFADEICQGIFQYLENKCALRLLPLEQLFERMEKMLERIGCESIARELRPLAPPVQVCLQNLAKESGCEIEMVFFMKLRHEIEDLQGAGGFEIRLLHARECVMQILQVQKWDKGCERLMREICQFLRGFDEDLETTAASSVVLHLRRGRQDG